MGKIFTKDDLNLTLDKSDPQTFDRLFNTFFPAIIYFAESIIHNREEAEDIVMETFRKLWQLQSNFETVKKVKAFLYISVRNACFNHLQSFYRRKYNLQAEINEEKGDYETNCALDAMKTKEENIQIQTIYTAVQKLPTKCRQVFELFYFEGKSSQEIAKQLNTAVTTARNQRARGVLLIKQQLTGSKKNRRKRSKRTPTKFILTYSNP